MSKLKGNSRVLATQYTEAATAKSIPWIGFYKINDLDGQILRHVLVAAGTTLAKLNGTSLTTLLSGRTEGLFHSASQFERFLLITNQDPELTGRGDMLVKYDGAVISKWGLTAPGSTETVREGFSDSTSFTSGPGVVSVSNESTTTLDGAAIKIDKTNTTNRTFFVEKAFDNPFYAISDQRDSSRAVANRVNFQVYIPRGQLTADYINSSTFNTNEAAMVVYISPDATTINNNFWKFYVPIGQLLEGWNQIDLDFTGAPTGFRGHFYPEVDIIRRTKIDFRLGNEAHTRTGIRLDRFVSLDEGTPVATPSGTGTMTGAYQYKVTYVSKYGHESNAGPASISVTAASNARITLTRLPVSDDPQVIARQIYRTVAGGSIYLFLDRVDNNTTTTFVDTTPDGSLGVSTPPQAGDFSNDNSPPPQAGIVKVWKNTVFLAGDPQNPTTLYFSDADEPESFPLINAIDLDDKITAMYETYSTLIIETETGKWQVLGDNPDFSVDKIIHNMGCVGRRAAGSTRIIGYSVDRDCLRLFDGNNTYKISEPIRNKYDDLNTQNIELVHTAHSRMNNILVQFNPDGTTPVPDYSVNDAFAYIYSKDDPNNGYWSTINFPSTLNILAATEIEDSNGAPKLYATSSDGMIYEMFNSTTYNWTSATGTTTAISTQFQTPFLRIGEMGQETYGVTGRVEPMFIEMRVANNSAITWTCLIESADGPTQPVVRDSQTLSLEFGTNNSLIRYRVKPNFHPGEFVRLTFTNEQQDVFSDILGIRMYFKTHAFEGVKQTVSSS